MSAAPSGFNDGAADPPGPCGETDDQRRVIARAAPLSPPRTHGSIRAAVATALGFLRSACCFLVHQSTTVLSSPRSLMCEAPSPRSRDRTTSNHSANRPVRSGPHAAHDHTTPCLRYEIDDESVVDAQAVDTRTDSTPASAHATPCAPNIARCIRRSSSDVNSVIHRS